MSIPKDQWLKRLDPTNPKHVQDAYLGSVLNLQKMGVLNRPGAPIAIAVAVGDGPHIGVCLSCRCTELSACDGGCGWALPNLCTRCRDLMVAEQDSQIVARTGLEVPR